ncbi:MAG: hypothetical protein ACKVYV_08680 [Limisphaerales bacterium]
MTAPLVLESLDLQPQAGGVGGSYVLAGALVVPAAGVSPDGRWGLSTGPPAQFIVTAAGTDRPPLALALAGAELELSWPERFAGFVLEVSPAVAGAEVRWSVADGPAETVRGHVTVRLPRNAEGSYFRLRRP